MEPLLLLLIAVPLAWFWLDGRRAHAMAVVICRRACERVGAQLLDETVALNRVGLRRNAQGRLCVRRMFTFDYSINTVIRQQGYIIMLGTEVEVLHIDAGESFKENAP